MKMNDSIPEVFILDDDPDVLRSLSLLVKSCQRHVRPFSNPHEMIEALSTKDKVVVICDLRMPAMDGFEVFKNLCALPGQFGFILLSGHIEGGEAKVAEEAGIQFILKKPIFKKALEAELAKVGEALFKD